MTDKPARVLFASRAFESEHCEGGFLILKDIAAHAASDKAIQAAFFSTCQEAKSAGGIDLRPAYSQTGWGLRSGLQFAMSLRRTASEFDVVHTAHVPTALNTRVLRRIRERTKSGGVRYVQTISALKNQSEFRSGMFWGDAVVCLNEATASKVRQVHDNVRMISPIPRSQRLNVRKAMPADIEARLSAYKIVCIPVDLPRIAAGFDVRKLCDSLLRMRPDVALVFACRFGEERRAGRLLGSVPDTFPGRVHVVGTIDWMPDLLAASSAILYPIHNLDGKFNPPMVLLEAAQLGARVVTAAGIQLDSLVNASKHRILSSNDHNEWAGAVVEMIDADGETCGPSVNFDDVYLQYVDLYRSLRDRPAQ